MKRKWQSSDQQQNKASPVTIIQTPGKEQLDKKEKDKRNRAPRTGKKVTGKLEVTEKLEKCNTTQRKGQSHLESSPQAPGRSLQTQGQL